MMPPPVLSEDILHEVAEQMLFIKLEEKFGNHEIDLRYENGHTKFMCLNPTTHRVFISKFSKMKDITFEGTFEGQQRISLYRDKKKCWDKGIAFYGPYLVTKNFIGALIDNAKFRVSSMRTCFYLSETLQENDDGTQQHGQPLNSMQTFSKLFLNKELSDEIAPNIPLALEELDIDESNKTLGYKFGELLNLNAKNVVVTLNEHKLFDCTLLARNFTADRLEKLEIRLNFSTYYGVPFEDLILHWTELFGFLLDVSPNIRQIQIDIFYEMALGESAEQFMSHLSEMVHMFVDKIFPSLSEGGSMASISVKMELECDSVTYEGLSLNTNQLFKMGEAKIDDDEGNMYTARECKVTDPSGRTHKCMFQVTGREISYSSGEMQDLLDDFDFGGPMDYDYDDYNGGSNYDFDDSAEADHDYSDDY